MRCYHDTASYPVTRTTAFILPPRAEAGWYHRSGHESRAGASPITISPWAMWYADGPYTWPELRRAAFLNRVENIYWMWALFMRGAYYITTQWLLSARLRQSVVPSWLNLALLGQVRNYITGELHYYSHQCWYSMSSSYKQGKWPFRNLFYWIRCLIYISNVLSFEDDSIILTTWTKQLIFTIEGISIFVVFYICYE